MKIALAQINYHIGNFENNTQKILQHIKKAKEHHADLIVFAELAISGYPPRDFLEFSDFIDTCYQSIKQIAKSCTDIAAIIGGPSPKPDIKGKDLFNTAFFLYQGKIQHEIGKALLPNYDIFDEYRYFEPNRSFRCIPFKNRKIALTICEDIWDIGEDPLYTLNPMDELIKENPDVMINIAASPFNYRQAKTRKEVLRHNVLKYNKPLIYVNHVGAQTELLFDGGSLYMDKQGKILHELNYFAEDFQVIDLSKPAKREISHSSLPQDKIALIHDALIMGIRNYFGKLRFQKAILGLSGGIDSAVTLALAAKALSNENVLAVLLPSAFSSEHSVSDSVKLCRNIGCPYEKISINACYEAFENSLQPHFKGLDFDVTEENIQARIRAVLLMALSNKFNYILLNTSNKSEAAVGYGTLYGDMCGGLSVLGDVYKSDVYRLAEYMNKMKITIPTNIITKPPSAELRPDQKDSDSLPDYDILDKILYQYIELRKGPREIIQQGYEESLVRKILKLVNTNEYKRHQTPPILRISSKAFGMGRRMPIVGRYLA